MRFMLLMYLPPRDLSALTEKKLAAMMKFNGELADAGVLLGLDGLHPTAKCANVRFQDGKALVTDGPFAETKEVIGGFWMIKADSLEEAKRWAERVPLEDGDLIEIRQGFELSDFPEELKKTVTYANLCEKLEARAGA